MFIISNNRLKTRAKTLKLDFLLNHSPSKKYIGKATIMYLGILEKVPVKVGISNTSSENNK